MRSPRAKHNLFAVSAGQKETAINTEQTLDTTMLIDIGNILNLEPKREDNSNELNGMEEADTIYDLGGLSSLQVDFPKAQPQHFAFLLAYGLGHVSSVAAGAGFEHTLTPIDDDLDRMRSNPSFTGGFCYGAGVLKRLVASLFVDSVTATFAKDSWVKVAGALKGTGKVTANVMEETVSAALNATSLTLSANGVQGATVEKRMDSIHSIIAETSPGVWSDVEFSAVSAVTPAVITITAPGVTATAVNYKILYVPTEPAWCTFPPKVVETALRVSEITVNIGGAWDGTTFAGGRVLTGEVNSIEYSLTNSLEIAFVPGGGGDYASRCFRPERKQILKLNREMRDAIMQNRIDQNTTFGVRIIAQGALYDATNHYQVEMIFPKVGVLTAPISLDGKKLAEAGDMHVLQHATYGSAIIKVKNLVPHYAV